MKIQLQLLLLSLLLFTSLFGYSQNCGEVFTDSGGVDGNYSNLEVITTTICPDVAGNVVTIVFNSFETEANFDSLKIYDGDNIEALLLGEFDGANSPGIITASLANGGCLTFLFHSDGSGVRDGWNASVNCGVEPTCITPIVLVNETSITVSTVEVSIVDNNTILPNSWEIEYGTSGFVQGTGTVDIANTETYQIIGLSTDSEYDVYVRANCDSDNSYWFGPIIFRTAISCHVVEGITVNNIAINSAELSWTDINIPTVTNWTLLYGESGFDVDVDGTSISTTINSQVLSGLTTSTRYDVYMQTNCGIDVDDNSQWIGPYQFSTLCNTITAPYTEDFESTGSTPDCWKQGSSNTEMWLFSNGTTNNGQVNNVTTSGGYFAYVDDSSPHNTITTLVSPMIDVSNLVNPELSFYKISNNGGGVSVNFSVDIWDGSQWNIDIYTSNTNTEGWEIAYVNLTTLNISGDIQARFIVEDDSTNFRDDFAIDDVSFGEVIVCRQINGLTVNSITENSATIVWNDTNSSTPIGWEIELVNAQESPTGTGILVSNLTYTFHNLLPLRNYNVYVKTQCSSTEYSEWRLLSSFRTLVPIAIDVPYFINSIPFQLYGVSDLESINTDDDFSRLFDIGFNFNFFGYNYERLTISDNGVVSFDPNVALLYHNWVVTDNVVIPSNNYTDNAIFGVFQDLFNINGLGLIAKGKTGTAPFRKFVILYENVPMYYCTEILATNQVILYESYNFIDVQIKDKNVCTSWQNGRAILGIQSIGGQYAYSPPNRNTGTWEAHNEGWRFKQEQNRPEFQYIVCDSEVDGIEIFDLSIIIAHFDNGSGNQYALFVSEEDAINNTNEIIGGTYVNTSNTQTIYLRDFDGATATIRPVLLATIDCTADYDLDTVNTIDEDLNGNGNYGDDDTDGDNIPDFIDEDDDGDFVLTNVEAVVTRNRNGSNTSQYIDTDGDNIPNYIDNDDDNDGILTVNEDYNGDTNPENDDTNNDGIPDYLQQSVALSIAESILNVFSIYPNPAKDKLIIVLNDAQESANIRIFNMQGQEVYAKMNVTTNLNVDITNLNSGVYFVNVNLDNKVSVQKFVKE